MRSHPHRGILSLLFIVASCFCFGQTWQVVNPPLNLFNGRIDVTHFDASGRVYAGGLFKNSDGQHFVAHWTGTHWAELGSGSSALKANGAVITLTSFGSDLYAAGAFTNASYKYSVSKWNGTAWSEVGIGTNALNANDIIYSLTVDKTGNIYAAGNFTNATGKHYVAKWNGTTWAEVGTGVNALNANSIIYAVATDVSGNVYAGGYFTNASGRHYVAKWNGTSWSEVGTGSNALNAKDYISCLATDQNGAVYVGGSFRNSQLECYLAKWDGTMWTEVGSGAGALQANNAINSIAISEKSEVYVAGIFTDQIGTYYVAKWNGTEWSQVNNPQSPLVAFDKVQSITVDARDNICAGGFFKNKSGHSYVAYWNKSVWSELGGKGDPFYTGWQGMNQVVGDTAGNVYASGGFQDAGGRYYIQHWNGNGWQRLEIPDTSSISLFLGGSQPLAVDRKGILYAPGRKRIASSAYDCILKWDGSQWDVLEDFPNSLGTSNDNPVYGIEEIETDVHDNIYVAGSFTDPVDGLSSLAKWDGKTWVRLQGSSAGIQNFCVAGDGTIYAYGAFRNSFGGHIIAKYHPVTQQNWVEVNSGSSQLSVPGFNVFMSLATDSKNNLYVNGSFNNASGNRYVAKWNGQAWQELSVTSSLGVRLAIDRADNIYVNKDENASGGDPVKKWNGSSWVGLGLLPGAASSYSGGTVLGTDRAGNLYTDARSPSGVGSYVVRYLLRIQNTWVGSVNSDWENPLNWSASKVPDANTDVVIPEGTIVVNASTTIRSLSISSAANLTLKAGVTLTILE